MNQPLSPAAQAVQDAFLNAACGGTGYDMGRWIAAVLRVVADQVTPEVAEPKYTPSGNPNLDVACVAVWQSWYANNSVRTQLCAIAAELEGATTTTTTDQP